MFLIYLKSSRQSVLQSLLTNSWDVFTNLEFRIYDFFNEYLLWFLFNWQTEKKKLFWTNKKLVFFFNCSNWGKFVEKIRETNWWKHLMNSIFEFPSSLPCFLLKTLTLQISDSAFNFEFKIDYWKLNPNSIRTLYVDNTFHASCDILCTYNIRKPRLKT